jgi:lysophospholipase L1-like esterase
VTFNPQWLYGRVCPGVEPPHARYACLLAEGPVTGEPEIAVLAERLAASGIPTLVVLMPTSTDALDDDRLRPLVALANQRLAALVPGSPTLLVVDQRLTSGRAEFAEGRGFNDMVHPTATGAALIAADLTAELTALAAR